LVIRHHNKSRLYYWQYCVVHNSTSLSHVPNSHCDSRVHVIIRRGRRMILCDLLRIPMNPILLHLTGVIFSNLDLNCLRNYFILTYCSRTISTGTPRIATCVTISIHIMCHEIQDISFNLTWQKCSWPNILQF